MSDNTAGTSMDLRARIAAASKRHSALYTLLGTDVQVEIRSMTVGQRSRFKDIANPDKDGQPRGKLDQIQFHVLRECVYDPDNGKALFKDGDLAAVQEMNPEMVDALVKECMSMSGLGREASAAAKNE
jgi:hypothetical protein